MILRRFRRIYRRIFCRKNYIFRCDLLPDKFEQTGLVVERYQNINEVPAEVWTAIRSTNGDRAIDRDRQEMKDLAVLWVGRVEGCVAGTVMSRSGKNFRKWFVELKPNDVVIFRTRTFPKYRGRGICPEIMRYVMQTELALGSSAFADCRVYNRPSIRSLKKAGFQRIATMKPIDRKTALGVHE